MSRSGVFVTCMSEIERVKVEGGVDIFQTVKTARAQRPHMVASHVSREICVNCNVTSKSSVSAQNSEEAHIYLVTCNRQ